MFALTHRAGTRDRHSVTTRIVRISLAMLVVFAALPGGLARVTSAQADGGDYSLDFVAAEPFSYDHSTGGGAFNDRTIGTDVVE